MVSLLSHYAPAVLGGLLITLQLCGIAWIGGIVAGALVGFLALMFPKTLGRLIQTVARGFHSVPFLIILFWLHYPAQALFNVTVPPFITASLALLTFNVLSISDLIVRGYDDFPKEYLDAARTTGLSTKVTYTAIVLPILGRRLFPAVVTLQITVLHLSLFASLISVDEIFRVIQRINSHEYRPTELYSFLALLFGGITMAASLVAAQLKSRFTQELSAG